MVHKIIFTSLIAILLMCDNAVARGKSKTSKQVTDDNYSNDYFKDLKGKFDIVPFSLYHHHGYRVDNVDFNVASDITGGATPNILSELQWTNVKIYQSTIDGVIPLSKTKYNEVTMGQFFLDGYLSQGNIFAGDNQDSNYTGDDRTNEFSRSNNNAGSGSTRDYSLGLNYKFIVLADISENNTRYYLTPNIGYSIHKQNLVMTDGYQTVGGFTGSFLGLNNSYDTEWKGPFIGIKISAHIKDRHEIELDLKYHDIKYYAQADWNLRSDLQHPKSFEHEAEGSGNSLSFKYKFNKTKNLSFNFLANYQNFETDPGINRTFYSSGSSTDTRLNKVGWDSRSAMVGIGYDF